MAGFRRTRPAALVALADQDRSRWDRERIASYRLALDLAPIGAERRFLRGRLGDC